MKIWVFLLIIILFLSFFTILINDSKKCQNHFGGYFSNSTSDRLHRIGNICFGWTNQHEDFPDIKLKTYKFVNSGDGEK